MKLVIVTTSEWSFDEFSGMTTRSFKSFTIGLSTGKPGFLFDTGILDLDLSSMVVSSGLGTLTLITFGSSISGRLSSSISSVSVSLTVVISISLV